jgi:hypothetical protein
VKKRTEEEEDEEFNQYYPEIEVEPEPFSIVGCTFNTLMLLAFIVGLVIVLLYFVRQV